MPDTHAPTTADVTLNAMGLMCPLPVLKAKQAMRSVPEGGLLEVLATDPLAKLDFAHFCNLNGYELLETTERPDGVLRLLLKKPSRLCSTDRVM